MSKSEGNIFSKLKNGRTAEELLRSIDPYQLFEIPHHDVYRESEEEDAPYISDERIVLGSDAITALYRLYKAFGIQDMPQTVGEYFGGFWYCRVIYSFISKQKLEGEDKVVWEKAVDDVVSKVYPELFPSLLAKRVEDLTELKRIARERMTLREISKHYCPRIGWVGTPGLEIRLEEEQEFLEETSQEIYVPLNNRKKFKLFLVPKRTI